MTPLVKAVLALALVVPLVAYVAGSLASSGAQTPERQGPVYIDDVAPASERSTPTPPRRSTPARTPARPSPTRDNQPRQAPRNDGGEARVVTPTPVDDDLDDDEREDDRDDDIDDTDDGDDGDD